MRFSFAQYGKISIYAVFLRTSFMAARSILLRSAGSGDKQEGRNWRYRGRSSGRLACCRLHEEAGSDAETQDIQGRP
jgi:hypothetical protein